MRSMLLLAVLAGCIAGCNATETDDGTGVANPAAQSASTEPPSSTSSGGVTVIPDPTTPTPPVINQAVTRRARAALVAAGARQLVETPGYEGDVNTAFTGVWRGRPFRSYTVPTPQSVDGELTLVARSRVDGHPVDVMQVLHGSVRLLRFVRGSDTWLLASLSPDLGDSDMNRSLALVAGLLP